MRSPVGALIFLTFIFLLDVYVFQAVKTVSHSASPKTKAIVYGFYWGITVFTVVGFFTFCFWWTRVIAPKSEDLYNCFYNGIFTSQNRCDYFYFGR